MLSIVIIFSLVRWGNATEVEACKTLKIPKVKTMKFKQGLACNVDITKAGNRPGVSYRASQRVDSGQTPYTLLKGQISSGFSVGRLLERF